MDPAILREQIYVPGRRGSLQLELLAASRTVGRLPVRIPASVTALVALLDSGRPVLVLQNLGIALIPVWHYAVVVGYLPASDQFVLRSGSESRRLVSRTRFDRSWRRADRWGIALFEPSEPAVGVTMLAYLDEAAAFESLGKPEIALQAYQSAIEQWPLQALPWVGLGNTLQVRGRPEAAVDAFTQALDLAPDNLVARNNLADVLAALGCDTQALAVIDAAPPDVQRDSLYPRLLETRSEIASVVEADHPSSSCRLNAAHNDTAP